MQTFPRGLAAAKQNPGKLNVGHPGIGTLGHITSELIQQFAGVKMTHVPYRGTAPLMTDLLASQVGVSEAEHHAGGRRDAGGLEGVY